MACVADLREPITISSLPPELLGAIFQEAQPKQTSDSRFPFELTISHVCRHWRVVAHSTPLLWTRIVMNSEKSMGCVVRYLEWSTTCPIDIRLILFHFDKAIGHESDGLSRIGGLVDVIIPHIQRCRTLLILTYYEETAEHISNQLSDLHAPILERLRINVDLLTKEEDSDDSQNLDLSPIQLFKPGSPRLAFFENEALNCFPSLTNITTLHLHRMYYGDTTMKYVHLLRIAHEAPSLENLWIRGLINLRGWPEEVNGQNIEMHSLRALLLSDSASMVEKLLNSLNAPKLESLWFESFTVSSRFLQIQNYPRFQSLKYLTVQECDTRFVSRLPVLFPSITHLHLAHLHLYTMRYLHEALSPAFGIPWPNLEKLALRTRSETHTVQLFKLFDTIFTSRRYAGKPIREFLFDGDLLRAIKKKAGPEHRLMELMKMEELSVENYREPWWVMSHQHTADRI